MTSPKPPPGERIKQFREELGLTVFELSDKCGEHMAAMIADCERGHVDPLQISVRVAIKIAKALGRTLDEVFA